MMFMADPILLAEPDSTPPIDNMSYELGFIYDSLKMFLDDMIEKHAQYIRDVPQISSEEDRQKVLVNSGKRFHLYFIIDKLQEVKNDQLVDRMNDMIILNKIAGSQAAAGYIDYSCFPYLGELFRFRDKEVPLLVVFDSLNSAFLRSGSKLNIYDGRTLIEGSVLSEKYHDKFRKVKFQLGLDH